MVGKHAPEVEITPALIEATAFAGKRYGVRVLHRDQRSIVLQIGGARGRVLLGAGRRRWWTKPPIESAEVFEVDFNDAVGDTWPTREDADRVRSMLTRE